MKLNYTTHIQEIDNKHHLHPFTEHKALRKKNPRVITSAEGVYIHDSEGQKILDGMSGLWCVNLGYGVEALCDCLLYTSPSPRDRQKSRMPSSA